MNGEDQSQGKRGEEQERPRGSRLRGSVAALAVLLAVLALGLLARGVLSHSGDALALKGQTPSSAPSGKVAVVSDAPAPRTSKSAPGPAQPARRVTRPAVEPQARPPARAHAPAIYRRSAFAVPGAPRQKASEMLLSRRAVLLERFIARRPKPSDRNVQHWLYQHAWIVTGALYGWPSGEQAVARLVAVDRRVEALWGIGAKSEAQAESALLRLRARR